jgi:hypothetical protein
MHVRELIERLRAADPDATVLLLDEYGDNDDADEVHEVDVQRSPWTHETGLCANSRYEVYYPGPAETREAAYHEVVARPIHVVVLSSGPTNLRYEL